jgi:ubiquinone/menaquinone biosynthesis C-methylase UbiE/uncharacterized protein YbaR (Trm112 family)
MKQAPHAEPKDYLIDLLVCPFCGGKLATQSGEIAGTLEYGILACYCSYYPVVAGIPVLKKGVIGTEGQTVDQVNALISSGRGRDALLAMIMPPPKPNWIDSLPNVTGIYRLKRLARDRRKSQWRERAALSLLDKNQSARALFDFYFKRSGVQAGDEYNYWINHFSQPRHLVGLSFANLIDRPRKPVLDLACGYGYITRYLESRANGQLLIAADREFFKLYVAKRWFSVGARYLCCDADVALPFADDAFSAIFCSDAFHFFTGKVTCIRELKRLSGSDGIILLVSIVNSLAKGHNIERRPLPDGYEAMLNGMPHRMVSHRAVMERYVEKQGPPLARSTEMTVLLEDMWFSIVASYREELFKDHEGPEDWPHAQGRLELNPLYTSEHPPSNGIVRLHKKFPSSWYETENGGFKQERYLPEEVVLEHRVLADLKQGHRTPAVERLIEQCVVVGVPEHY